MIKVKKFLTRFMHYAQRYAVDYLSTDHQVQIKRSQITLSLSAYKCRQTDRQAGRQADRRTDRQIDS